MSLGSGSESNLQMPRCRPVFQPMPAAGLLSLQAPAGIFAEHIGLRLPTTPCTFTADGEVTAYWLAPDEWLLRLPTGRQGTVEERWQGALAGSAAGGAVVDVSSAYVGYRLVGGATREVLMKASPVDFHPRAFAAGRCVQTVFAKTGALIACTGASAFDVLVRRSYADYVQRWVADAMDEYPAAPRGGLAPSGPGVYAGGAP